MYERFFLEMNNYVIGIVSRNYEIDHKQILGIYHRYISYFEYLDFKVLLITKNNIDVVFSLINSLALIGGGDVSPLLYNKELPIDSNEDLDSLEYRAIKLAINKKIPIFGICRGLQILNVYFGGTLKEIPSSHLGMHYIINSEEITKYTNSFHHQCIDKLANNFKCLAKSEDFVIEEIIDKKRMILAVEYHPEINYDYEPLQKFIKLFFK